MSEESRRSRSAKQYVLDAPLTARLETVLRVVADALDFPSVRVNIIDEDTQHTIRLFGDGKPVSVARQNAFCNTVVRTGHPLIVQDAANDPVFSSFPAVIDGVVGSYLGVPLVGREALVIGAVCVVDPGRRTITSDHLAILIQLGKILERQLELLRGAHEQRLAAAANATGTAGAIRERDTSPWYQPLLDRVATRADR
jgi:GAF domain-containing protein